MNLLLLDSDGCGTDMAYRATMPDYVPIDYGEDSQDDEDGFPWDIDRGGDLGNYEDD